MMSAATLQSTRPYLIRALYEWCGDQGLTPYIAVWVDDQVQVPREYVQGGEIVLNISMDATSGLTLGNDCIEFKTRFGGVPRTIVVPIGNVLAIYARENGQGMAFPVGIRDEGAPADDAAADSDTAAPFAKPAPKLRPVESAPNKEPAAAATPPALHAVTPAGRKTVAPACPSPPFVQTGDSTPPPTPPRPRGGKPALKRIK